MEVDWLSWRTAIWFALGAVSFYLISLGIRLWRFLRATPPAPPAGEQRGEPEATASVGADTAPQAPRPAAAEPVAAPAVAVEQPPPENHGELPALGFEELLTERLTLSALEREVRLLRDELDALRQEVAALRHARHVAPQYAEALALAQNGADAREIADRLGITLAEAELVYALSRGEALFEQGELDGNEPNEGDPWSDDGRGDDRRRVGG